MKKQIFLWAIALLISNGLAAQQLGQHSQYQQNPFVLNPAAAGIEPYLDITLSYRKQWTGIEGSPQTYYASANTSLTKFKKPSYKPASLRISKPNRYNRYDPKRKLRHAIGGFIASDEAGAFRQTIGNAGYAIHLPISRTFTWSVGTSVGATQILFDRSKVSPEVLEDPIYAAFQGNTNTSTVVDLNFGTWFYNNELYIGYSTAQLLQNEVTLGDAVTGNERKMHHFLTAGYKLYLTPEITFTPNFLVRYLDPLPVSYDISAKFDYRQRIWGAVSYRQNDAIVGMVGMTISDMLKFGYAYDFTTSQLQQYSSGSHEVVLGIMLNKANKITF
ncbi:MAG: type IX secretion system membrane protein PorP/SprF [Salibacteraceae bacterium]